MINVALLFLIFIITFVFPITEIKGYKNHYYQLDSDQQQLCEFSKKFSKNWCVGVQKNPIGLYAGFNQLIVYSKTSLLGFDAIRRQAKWSIDMKNAFKIHINYPVIVIFYQDKRLVGYDYFSGFQLWEKQNINYNNMFETQTDLWLVNQSKLDKLDVVSGDVIFSLVLKNKPTKMVGNEIYLYYQTNQNVFHYNIYSKVTSKVGRNYKILDQTSTLIKFGNDQQSELRTFSNRAVTDNVKVDLFKIHSPTKSQFAFINQNQLFLIDDKRTKPYEFSHKKNKDVISYGYKLNNKLRVFYENGNDLWILKPPKKNELEHDI